MPKIVELFKQLVDKQDKGRDKKPKEPKPPTPQPTMRPAGGYTSNKKDVMRQLDNVGNITSKKPKKQKKEK